jgi:hypothetical protein
MNNQRRDANAGLAEDGAEWIDNARNQLAELGQCWKERFTMKNRLLSKRYIDGELRLHLHMKLRLERTELCAIYKVAVLGSGGHPQRNSHGWVSSEVGMTTPREAPEIQAQCLEGTEHGNQESVFVSDVHLVDLPESFVCTSLVRFDLLEKLHSLCPKAVFHSLNFGFIGLGVPLDREVVLIAQTGVTGLKETSDDVIEGRPQVVEDVANHGSPLGIRIPVDVDGRNALAGIQITIGKEDIRVAASEFDQLGLQLIDVMVGPFDLGVYRDEEVWHGVSSTYERQLKAGPQPEGAEGLRHPDPDASGSRRRAQEDGELEAAVTVDSSFKLIVPVVMA